MSAAVARRDLGGALVGREIAAPDGTRVFWPIGLMAAIDMAARASFAAADYAAWRTAFAEALVLALHDAGVLMAPRAFAASRESVTLNVYSMTVAAKQGAERTVRQARDIFRGDACRGDLHGEFDAALRSLTGHARLAGVGRIAGVDERLRQLRQLLLQVGLDEPAREPPQPHSPIDGSQA